MTAGLDEMIDYQLAWRPSGRRSPSSWSWQSQWCFWEEPIHPMHVEGPKSSPSGTAQCRLLREKCKSDRESKGTPRTGWQLSSESHHSALSSAEQSWWPVSVLQAPPEKAAWGNMTGDSELSEETPSMSVATQGAILCKPSSPCTPSRSSDQGSSQQGYYMDAGNPRSSTGLQQLDNKHRNLRFDHIVLVSYEHKYSKPDFRILDVCWKCRLTVTCT